MNTHTIFERDLNGEMVSPSDSEAIIMQGNSGK